MVLPAAADDRRRSASALTPSVPGKSRRELIGVNQSQPGQVPVRSARCRQPAASVRSDLPHRQRPRSCRPCSSARHPSHRRRLLRRWPSRRCRRRHRTCNKAWLARTGGDGGNARHRPARRPEHGRGWHRRQEADTGGKGGPGDASLQWPAVAWPGSVRVAAAPRPLNRRALPGLICGFI